MRLIATMPCKNEDWVLGLTARAVLMWCDELILLDHWSTDRSREIMNQVATEFPGRVTIEDWRTVEWTEMAMRQSMLLEARERGVTHIALVDADEILTGNLLPCRDQASGCFCIKCCISRIPPRELMLLPWVCLCRGIDRYYTDGLWFNKLASLVFKDSPELHWRTREGYDLHHRHPMGREFQFYIPLTQTADPAEHQGGGMHLQFLSERRLLAKQALYQITETLRWPGRVTPEELAKLYGRTVYESDPAKVGTSPVPESWWAPYQHLLKYLDIDSKPWQEAEVIRLVAEYGKEKFQGLDLFGVA